MYYYVKNKDIITEPYYIEGCHVLKQEIYLQKANTKQLIMQK